MTTRWEGYFIFKNPVRETSSKIKQQVYNIIRDCLYFSIIGVQFTPPQQVIYPHNKRKQIAVEPQHSLHRTQYYQTDFQWKWVIERKGELSCLKYLPEKI